METVTRYVITHKSKTHNYKLRILSFPAQGRYTWKTEAEALEVLKDLSGPSGFRQILDAVELASLRVIPCPCYPQHFDPARTVWGASDFMETKNGELFFKSHIKGKMFRITYIAHNAEECNKWLEDNPGSGVIEELQNGIVVIASVYEEPQK